MSLSKAPALFLQQIEGIVHRSAMQEPLALAEHRAFISSRLLIALGALGAFPVFIVISGTLGSLGIGLFALLIATALPATLASVTGNLSAARLLSAILIAGLVAVLAPATGGLSSPYLIWLAVIPFEAFFVSQKRRAVLGFAAAPLALMAIAVVSPVSGGGAGLSVVDRIIWPILIASAALGYATLLLWQNHRQGHRERMAADAAVERHRFLADNVTDVVSRHDRDGNAAYVSPAAARLLGVPADALMGERWKERVHPDDRRAFVKLMRRTADSVEPETLEFRLRRSRLVPVELQDYASEDDYVWAEIRGRRTAVADPTDCEIVAVTRDVTARKAQERVLESAREEAERANRAKTRFLANVSHELRTPLNAIIGFSEILDKEIFGPLGNERNREYVGLIHDSGSHLLQLVNDILDMSKIESGKFEIFTEPFAVRPMLASCVSIVEPISERKDVAITVHVPSDFPEVNADKRACKQMIINLLSNAVKFTDTGGRVTVEASLRNGVMGIVVSDTGIGIAPEDIARLGRPFVQADTSYSRAHEGTGLGLSVVRGLVELHGGMMQIDSELGMGTSVTLTFPDALNLHNTGQSDEGEGGADDARLSA